MDVDYASQYERLAREHWWWQARTQFILDAIGSLELPERATILDVGCGGGWSFDAWQRFGEVNGVELDPTLVGRAGRHESKIHCGPFDRRYRPGKRFSLIVMLDVLEHLEDPEAALSYALELLEPGGRILITVPAMPWLWTSHDDLNHHFVRYTKGSFQSLAVSSGMSIERLDYFFYWTTFAKLIFRIKESLIATPPSSPTIPSPRVNALFRNLCLAEQRIFRKCPLPVGTSLVCVGRK